MRTFGYAALSQNLALKSTMFQSTAQLPAKNSFPILRQYSPLHNVEKRKYPPVLLNTGSHDDRVCPAHSYKFAATLQQNQTGDAPVLQHRNGRWSWFQQ